MQGTLISMGGGKGFLDVIKSKGLVLLNYIRISVLMKRGGTVIVCPPLLCEGTVTIYEAQKELLKTPKSTGTLIFNAGLLTLWHWDFCYCKSPSLRVPSLPPPVPPLLLVYELPSEH